MTKIAITKEELLELVIQALASISDIESKNGECCVELYKDKQLFCKITDDCKILLLNHIGDFEELDSELIKELIKSKPSISLVDKFLLKATKAYWIAQEHEGKLKNLQGVLKDEI